MFSTVLAKLFVLVVFLLACFLSLGFGVTFEAYKPYARTDEVTPEKAESASFNTHAQNFLDEYGTPDLAGTQAHSGLNPTTTVAKVEEDWTESRERFLGELDLDKVTGSVENPDEVTSTPSLTLLQDRPIGCSPDCAKIPESPQPSGRGKGGIRFEMVSEEPLQVSATTWTPPGVDEAEMVSAPAPAVAKDFYSGKPDDDAELVSISRTNMARAGKSFARLHNTFLSPPGKDSKKSSRIWRKNSITKAKTEATATTKGQATSAGSDQASDDNGNRTTTSSMKSSQHPESSVSQSFPVSGLETAIESSSTLPPKSSALPSSCCPSTGLHDEAFETSKRTTLATTLHSPTTTMTTTTTPETATTSASPTTTATASATTASPTTSTTPLPEADMSSKDGSFSPGIDVQDSAPSIPESTWQNSLKMLRMFPDDVTRKDLTCAEIITRSCLLEHLGLTYLDPEGMSPRELNRTCHERYMIHSCVRMKFRNVCNRVMPPMAGTYALINYLCADKESHLKYMRSVPDRRRVSLPELERCQEALECQFMNLSDSGLEKHLQDIICLDEHLRQFCYSAVWFRGHVTDLTLTEFCQYRLRIQNSVNFERLDCRPNPDLVCFPPDNFADYEDITEAMLGYTSNLLRELKIF